MQDPFSEELPRPPGPRGRGAGYNPANRFVPLSYEAEITDDTEIAAPVATQYFRDTSRSVIARNTSPDVGFEASVNPYRGCEHGCIYCYARPTHEYYGFSAGVDFETRILIKEDAPELLRRELSSPKWEPQLLVMSGVTDPYQPIEKRLQLTRRCLEVLAEFRNPVAMITKNHLISRDADILGEMASHGAAAATLSITTLDEDLRRNLEPRTSSPARRLDAISILARAGVPVGVNIAPVIPGLNEHEIPAILKAAADAGATKASFIMVRLPYAVAPLFERWLEDHAPGRKDKVLNRIRAVRGGKLNDPRFGSRMRGEGIYAREVEALFRLGCRRAGLPRRGTRALSTAAFRRPGGQLGLFEEVGEP